MSEIRATHQGAQWAFLAGVVLILGACVPENTRPNLFEPEPGISCYNDREICYDFEGPSVYHTRQYFGDYAADGLIQSLEADAGQVGGYGNAPLNQHPPQSDLFYPDDDVRCVRSDSICYRSYGPSVPATQRWLGYREARDLERAIENGQHVRFIPELDVRCSRSSGVCQNDGRDSYQDTRRWLGEAAAAHLAPNPVQYQPTRPNQARPNPAQPDPGLPVGAEDELRRQVQPVPVEDEYQPTPGTRCVRSEQVCYRAGKPDVASTREQFGYAAGERLERQLAPQPEVLNLSGRLEVRVRLPGEKPKNGRLFVAIKAQNPAAGEAAVLKEKELPVKGVDWPVKMTLSYPTGKVNPQTRYFVQAWVMQGGTLFAISDNKSMVLTQGGAKKSVAVEMKTR